MSNSCSACPRIKTQTENNSNYVHNTGGPVWFQKAKVTRVTFGSEGNPLYFKIFENFSKLFRYKKKTF